MFLTLLVVTFLISLGVCLVVERIFSRPIASILDRIISDQISHAWVRYIKFALYVVGISGGVRVHSLERYINPTWQERDPIVLNRDRWILEVYRTIIESLQAIAWMLLVFFVVALIAYVIVKIFESRRAAKAFKEAGV